MKKLLAIIMMVMVMFTYACAEITDEVYNFYFVFEGSKENAAMDIWKSLENYEVQITDGRLYMKGGCLNESVYDTSIFDIEDNIQSYFEERGAKHFDVHVHDVGRTNYYAENGERIHVLWIEINGVYDFNKIENYGLDESYYGMDILCYSAYFSGM